MNNDIRVLYGANREISRCSVVDAPPMLISDTLDTEKSVLKIESLKNEIETFKNSLVQLSLPTFSTVLRSQI